MTCRCESYNGVAGRLRDTVSGSVPEVVLTPPPVLGLGRDTVCVDACIAASVEALWAAGVVTLGSCCGHGRTRPSLVLGGDETDPAHVREVLASIDDRPWDLSQWQLVTLEPT